MFHCTHVILETKPKEKREIDKKNERKLCSVARDGILYFKKKIK